MFRPKVISYGLGCMQAGPHTLSIKGKMKFGADENQELVNL